MDQATDAELAADIALRVSGAQAVRRLRRRCQNQGELARLLGTTQQEISRVARTRARASRRVMRDALRADELITAAIEASVAGVIEGRIEAKKRAAPTAISHEQWRGINTGAHIGCDQPAPPLTLAAGVVVKP